MRAADVFWRTGPRRRVVALASIAAAVWVGGFLVGRLGQSAERATAGAVLAQDGESFQRHRVASKFRVGVLAQMGRAIDEAIAGGRIPGGVLWIEHDGVPFSSVHGYRSLLPRREELTGDTVFDIASLTRFA